MTVLTVTSKYTSLIHSKPMGRNVNVTAVRTDGRWDRQRTVTVWRFKLLVRASIGGGTGGEGEGDTPPNFQLTGALLL